jgi:hypothetical protein
MNDSKSYSESYGSDLSGKKSYGCSLLQYLCFGEVCQDKQCQILVTFLSDLIYALSQFLCRQDFVQL